MAGETQATQNDSGGSVWKTIAIVIGVLILLGLGAYLLFGNEESKEEQAQKELEEAAKQLEEEAMKMEEELAKQAEEMDAQKEADDNLKVFRASAEAVRPILSQNGVKSLDVIVLYVENDPAVLLVKQEKYPPEVQLAIETVQGEVKGAVAAAQLRREFEQAVVGQTVALQGTWVAEEIEDPIGVVYSLVDKESGNTFYFVFNEEDSVENAKFVGEEVTITVKITGLGEENYVTYTVVEGPTVVEAEADTTTTVPTTPVPTTAE